MNNIILALVLPFLGAFCIKTFLKRKPIIVATFFTLLQFISLLLISKTGTTVYFLYGIKFSCDFLSYIFAITSVIIGIFIFLYSIDYFSDKNEEFKNNFSFWSLILIGCLTGVVFSDNLFSLFIFWELAEFCFYKLIAFYKGENENSSKNNIYLVTKVCSAIIILFSFILIYINTNSLSILEMQGSCIPPYVFYLFFIGIMIKSATFPFHYYIPSTTIAPIPVVSFFNTILVNISLYGIAKLFIKTLFITSSVSWIGYIALFSSVLCGVLSFIEIDIKKILTYSTISQIGFMICGLLSFNEIAFKGIMVFYVANVLGKGCLFMCAGILEKVFKTNDITKISVSAKKMPVTFTAFLFSSLSIIGIPPFLGSSGKLNIIYGMLRSGNIYFAFFSIITLALTLFYILRLFKYIFIRTTEQTDIITENNERKYKFMMFCVLFLCILSLLGGIILTLLTGEELFE
ncbi:MAG TPA: proton-conducting transporter membrane subunit [Candidatus Ratteibacteria bacterium]|nr:proton-conducting transporter membrane subunit [Candidatus Ratteibacteria bacterium]